MRNKVLKIGIAIGLICILFILTGCRNSKNQNQNEEVKKNSKLSEVQVGDYVSYKPEVGKSYTATSDSTGYSKDQEIKVKGDEKCRVFKVNDNGTVDLISADGIGTSTREAIYFMGENGYNNAQTEINNMAQIFGTGEFAESVRVMNDDDLKSLVSLKNNVATLETEYKVDLSDCETEEDLWEAINQAENPNYNKEYTIGGKNVKVTEGLEWKSGYSGLGFEDLEMDSTAKSILGYDSYSEIWKSVWLGNKTVGVTENNLQDVYLVDYGISYYFWGENSSSFGSLSMYVDKVNRDTQQNTGTNTGKGDAYIRPIVTIKKDVKVDGGTGTEADPYILK